MGCDSWLRAATFTGANEVDLASDLGSTKTLRLINAFAAFAREVARDQKEKDAKIAENASIDLDDAVGASEDIAAAIRSEEIA